jgi:uncharacterized membrane protein
MSEEKEIEQEVELPGAEETKAASERADPEPAVQHTLTPADRDYLVSTKAPPPAAAPKAGITVAPNLIDVATGRAETAEEKATVRKVRDINGAVHGVLIVGLAVSTLLMLIGIVEAAVLRQPTPTVEPHLREILTNVIALRPSGFMTLGLVVLIATPILRVIGSVFAFAYERDWRFMGVTLLVFVIVLTSIFLGSG